MARIPGPPVTHCPLPPRKRPQPTGDRYRDMIEAWTARPRMLIWKRPTGWVVAHGWLEGGQNFAVLAADLPCWHLAAAAASSIRWREYDPRTRVKAGWTTPTFPAQHACWDVTCTRCGRQESDGCHSELDDAWTCADCHVAMAQGAEQ